MSGAESKAVQVVVRLRPLNEKESRGSTLPVVTASTDKSEVCICRGSGNRQLKQAFSFDKVFTSFTSQQEVFDQTFVQQGIIDDVLRGYESTVFAYGQTGTGKTFTMEGELASEELRGVIPRATAEIFERLSRTEWYEVKASYLEIYCEELCDLLHTGEGAEPKLAIHEDRGDGKGRRGKGMFVQGLSESMVRDEREVQELIRHATERRRVGETKMNARSSRSHCIFTLSVHSKTRLEDGAMIDSSGKLHLVDLAGSECAKSCTMGGASDSARERERKNINQSLLTLGRVIAALRDGSGAAHGPAHIPYRDSKLTRLLQESLGGRCKTCIIATLSPSALAADESLSTLQYAQMAMGITNKPVAMSYLKLGEGAAGAAGGGGGGGVGGSIEEWSKMEMRLAYMESQVAEAQSALARKHAALSEAEARADGAEARAALTAQQLEEANTELGAERERAAALESERDAAREEAARRARVLAATRRTEAKLTAEARALIAALRHSVDGSAALERALAAAAADDGTRRERSRAFAEAAAAALDALRSSGDEHAGTLAQRARDAADALRTELDGARARAREVAAAARAAAERSRAHADEGVAATQEAAAAAAAARAEEAERVASAHDALAAALAENIDAARAAVGAAETAAADHSAATEAWAEARSAAAAAATRQVLALARAQEEAEDAAAERAAADVDALRTALREHRDAIGSHAAALGACLDAQTAAVRAAEEGSGARRADAHARAQAVEARAKAIDDALAEHARTRADATLGAALGAAADAASAGDRALGQALAAAAAALDGAAAACAEGCLEEAARAALAESHAAGTAAAESAAVALREQTAALGATRARLEAWLHSAAARETAAVDELMTGVRALAESKLGALREAAAAELTHVSGCVEQAEGAVEKLAEGVRGAATTRATEAAAIDATLGAWGESTRAAATALGAGGRAAEGAREGAAEAHARVQTSHAETRAALQAWSSTDDTAAAALAHTAATLREDESARAAADGARDRSDEAALDGARALLHQLGVARDACPQLAAAASEADVQTAALGERARGARDGSRLAARALGAAIEEGASAEAESTRALVEAGAAPLQEAHAAADAARSAIDGAAAAARDAAAAEQAAFAAAADAAAAQWGQLASAGATKAEALASALDETMADAAAALEGVHGACGRARDSAHGALDECAAAARAHAEQAGASCGALHGSVDAAARDIWRTHEPVPPPPTAPPVAFSEALSATPAEEQLLGRPAAADDESDGCDTPAADALAPPTAADADAGAEPVAPADARSSADATAAPTAVQRSGSSLAADAALVAVEAAAAKALPAQRTGRARDGENTPPNGSPRRASRSPAPLGPKNSSSHAHADRPDSRGGKTAGVTSKIPGFGKGRPASAKVGHARP